MKLRVSKGNLPTLISWVLECIIEMIVSFFLLLCITGTHVRSAATLGGNIALGCLKDLESDVITVFMAAGASVKLVSKTDSR